MPSYTYADRNFGRPLPSCWCLPPQVTLLILESDQIKHDNFDKDGFVEVVVMGTSGGNVIGDAVRWAREQRFDVVFYPQVRCLPVLL